MLGSEPKFPSASLIFDQMSEKVKHSIIGEVGEKVRPGFD